MAGVKQARQSRSAAGARTSESPIVGDAAAVRLAARRAHVERRLRFLAREESRLAMAGDFPEAQQAARERRYWEFVRALLSAPAPVQPAGLMVH